jgi:hypothetical protein
MVNEIVSPAEEALNKQGSKKDFCYTLVMQARRAGV